MRFSNKIVVIIGGNSGIGRAAAEAFAAEDAQVVVTGRDQKTLDEVAGASKGKIVAVRSDVLDLTSTQQVMDRVRADHGRIDVLFVNAGIGHFISIDEIREDQYDQIMGINLKGAYFAVKKAIPLMSKGGAIVLTSSTGHVAGIPGNSVYGAAKAGIRSLARNLGAELVDRGIRVNCFSQGPIDTPLINRSGVPPAEVPALRKFIEGTVPMKRFGTPAEAASAVLFLASDDASFITGIDLFVDGGQVSF